MFLRILKKDLTRKKTMNVILFLFIIMCSMFASAGVNNIIAVNGGIDHFFEVSDMYDVQVTLPNDSDLESEIRNLPGITKMEKMEATATPSPKDWQFNGKVLTNFVNPTAIIPSDNMYIKFFDSDNHVIESVEPGHFYASSVFTQDTDIKVGDEVVLSLDDVQITFIYDGRLKGADISTDKFANPYVIMNREDYEKVLQDSKIQKVLEHFGEDKLTTYAIHTSDVKAVTDLIDDADNPDAYYYEQDMFRTYYLYDMLAAYIMMAICILLMITAFVMLRFTISFTISEEFREIGVMKAVGIDNGSIRRLYVVKYLAISIVASLIGFLCSIPLSKGMLKTINKNIVLGNKAGNTTGFISTIFVILIILLFCYLCTRKVRKLSPIDAVRNGQTGERFGKKSLMRLGRSKLPTTGFLAMNDVTSAKKRFSLIAVIFALSLLIMTLMSNFAETLKSDKITWAFGMTESDVTIGDTELLMDILLDGDSEETLSGVEKTLADNGMPGKCAITLMSQCTMKNGSTEKSIYVTSVEGHLTYTPKVMDGRLPEKDDEIAVTPKVLKDLDAEIGDTVTMKTDTRTYDFIITGTYSSFQTPAVYPNPGFKPEGIAATGCMGVQIKFDGNPDAKTIDDYVEKLQGIFNSEQVYTTSDTIKSMTGMSDTLNAIKFMMLGITVIVAAMIVILMERSFLSREKSEIALMKAVGVSDGSIIAQHVLRFVIVSIVAVIIASLVLMPISNAVMGWVCSLIGDVTSIECTVNVAEVFVIMPLILIAVAVLGSFFTALYSKSIKASDTASIE